MTVSNPYRQARPGAGSAALDEGLRRHMVRTYSLLAQGLALTAAAAFVAGQAGLLDAMRGPDGLTALGGGLMLSPLAVLLIAAFTGAGRSLATARPLYWGFVLLQGPGLALLASSYTSASVVHAAAAAATAFGTATLYGYTTSRRLDSLGAFMFMGLVGLIVASLANLYFGSPAVGFAVSAAAVLVFTGLAAWQTQAIKDAYGSFPGEEAAEAARYTAALGLYLDVVNLFSALLNLTGERE